jgi:branched-chain amino acid transport system ATP-binding protein
MATALYKNLTSNILEPTNSKDSGVTPVLLKVEALEKHFGGITALADYHMEIHTGELVGLIGPNGAGKTTVFNLLSGVLKPSGGRIYLEGRDITRLRADQNSALGISRTFQNIRLFNDLTVADNIKVSFHHRLGCGLWNTLFQTPSYRSSERKISLRCEEFLGLFDLKTQRNELARNLPYGLQRRVEIARAIATMPKLLLLDEPAAGLNINETKEIVALIRKIHRNYSLTIFLVEHDMRLIMAICERIQVIDRGHILAAGTPEAIRNDPRVIDAYLGKAKEKRHAKD